MNLVSMAMNFITPAILTRIASALGVDSKIAQMAINAALPAILAAIAGKSTKPEGLSQLTGLLGKQDLGMLSNIASMIGGAEQSKLVSNGSNMLGSLLGNQSLGAFTGALGKFAGMGDAPTKNLLGMIAPVALGTLAQQQKANSLDGAGLAKMLTGQKDNIAAALPAGFADMLKGTGILDGFSLPATKTVAAPATTAPPVRPAAAPAPAAKGIVHHASAPSKSLPNWLPWGGLLVALLAGWYLLGPGSGRRVTVPPSSVTYNGVNVAAQVNTLYDGLKTTIGTVKDQNTAQAALPRLQDAANQLDSLGKLASAMPAGTRADFASLVASYLPQIEALIKTALNTSGVGGVVKPVLDVILTRMAALAKA
jgi:hypothetical protein